MKTRCKLHEVVVKNGTLLLNLVAWGPQALLLIGGKRREEPRSPVKISKPFFVVHFVIRISGSTFCFIAETSKQT